MNSAIKVENLSFSYGKRKVLSGVTFSLEKGTAAAIVGENGSGKSTLLACLAGIVRPTAGKVCVSGKTAYVPQEISLVEELSFNDNLKYFASLASCKVPSTLPFGADKYRKIKIKRMSGGMKKLCSLCCTLICDADIYLFDEPCAALDKEHRAMLIEYISELVKRGKTVLYVGHDEAEYASFADTEICVENSAARVRSLCEEKE